MAPDVLESEHDHRRVQAVLRVGLALAVAAMLAGLAVCLVTGRCDPRRVRISALAGPMDPGLRLLSVGIWRSPSPPRLASSRSWLSGRECATGASSRSPWPSSAS